MDLIIDTNIIKGGNYFRSNNFNILFDYLKKTNSKIVLPQTVKEESIWHYKSDIREKLNTVNHLSNLCFIAKISGEVDVDNEEKAYLNYIEILKKIVCYMKLIMTLLFYLKLFIEQLIE